MFFHYLIRNILESSLEVFLIDPGLDILVQLQFRDQENEEAIFFSVPFSGFILISF